MVEAKRSIDWQANASRLHAILNGITGDRVKPQVPVEVIPQVSLEFIPQVPLGDFVEVDLTVSRAEQLDQLGPILVTTGLVNMLTPDQQIELDHEYKARRPSSLFEVGDRIKRKDSTTRVFLQKYNRRLARIATFFFSQGPVETQLLQRFGRLHSAFIKKFVNNEISLAEVIQMAEEKNFEPLIERDVLPEDMVEKLKKAFEGYEPLRTE